MYLFTKAGNGVKVALAALALSFLAAWGSQEPEPAAPSQEDMNRAIVLR